MPLTRRAEEALAQLLNHLGFDPRAVSACVDLLPASMLQGAHKLLAAHPRLTSRAALLGILRKKEPVLVAGLLVVAALDESHEVTEFLLSSGAPATGVDNRGRTALIALAAYRRPAPSGLVRKLLAGGCPINAADKQGWTALMFAFEREDLSLMSVLLEAGAAMPPEAYPWLAQLAFLCWNSSELEWCALARRAVAAGADPSSSMWDERLPLAALARSMGHSGCSWEYQLDLLDTLLELGADASVVDNDGLTPLHNLLDCLDPCHDFDVDRCRRVVQRLVAAGCEPNAYTLAGEFSCLGLVLDALKPACRVPPERQRGLLSLLDILLEAGADPLQPVLAGGTFRPLHYTLSLVSGELLHELPAIVLKVVEMLALASGLPGNPAFPDGPSVLQVWLDTLLDELVYGPERPCMQASKAHLELTQALLHYCYPRYWLYSQPSPGVLLEAVLHLGSVELLTLLMASWPLVGQAAAMLTQMGGTMTSIWFALDKALGKLLYAPEPDPQEGLTMAHAAPALALWRQVPVLTRAGAFLVELPPQYMAELLAMPKPWAHDSMGFMLVTASCRGWSPDSHFLYPRLFRQAASTLLLINGCRGFKRRSIALYQRPVTRSQQRRQGRRSVGLQLPAELMVWILARASQPVVCWCPQLVQHLSVPERQWLESLVPGCT